MIATGNKLVVVRSQIKGRRDGGECNYKKGNTRNPSGGGTFCVISLVVVP